MALGDQSISRGLAAVCVLALADVALHLGEAHGQERGRTPTERGHAHRH